MDDENEVQQVAAQDEQTSNLEIDAFLRSLVMLAMSGVSVDVSLTVNGIIVCGQIASGREYFERVIEDFDKGLQSEEIKKAIWPLFESYRDGYLPENLDKMEIAFIHLKDATFHSPAGAAGIPNGDARKQIWRGKLSHVSGFTLGRFK